MKDFLKDTWVLGLALIIGGTIVYRNASELSDVPADVAKEDTTAVESDKAPVAAKDVVVQKNKRHRVIYNNNVDEQPAKASVVSSRTNTATAAVAVLTHTNQPIIDVDADHVEVFDADFDFALDSQPAVSKAVPTPYVPEHLMPMAVNFEIPSPESLK